MSFHQHLSVLPIKYSINIFGSWIIVTSRFSLFLDIYPDYETEQYIDNPDQASPYPISWYTLYTSVVKFGMARNMPKIYNCIKSSYGKITFGIVIKYIHLYSLCWGKFTWVQILLSLFSFYVSPFYSHRKETYIFLQFTLIVDILHIPPPQRTFLLHTTFLHERISSLKRHTFRYF